ncbi:TTL domain-containing protein [Plectosphaerella plurivora]|uniref:TTL domain-containing protein n=1 Tax=Plectosphaerella plurivora TaxID=936078 RepID=A0A9P8VFH0_9PEZI|nr:TTL domain-containing protein [Plectosphaerella plurivora]
MKLLVVNDDGPPSSSSPYFAPFIRALNAAGHSTVVVIPDRPLSWISKAHAVGKSLTATVRCPSELVLASAPDAKVSNGAQSLTCAVADCAMAAAHDPFHHWLLVDGPPASCTQLGLFHSGFRPGDFDLVVSGPNHGRNSGALHTLSSGTVGGAMEGALCGVRAVALSFGSKEPQPDSVISDACARSVELIEELHGAWAAEVEVYSINVPMIADVATCPSRYTTLAANRWSKGSLFSAVAANADPEKGAVSRTLNFRWAPELSDVHQAAEKSQEGEDLWASLNGCISITPFKADFATAQV